VIPVGDKTDQQMVLVTKHQDGTVEMQRSEGSRFVRLIGRNGWSEES
jgi:protein-L-isoaspartate(D-aspartate) O-methyltransferase